MGPETHTERRSGKGAGGEEARKGGGWKGKRGERRTKGAAKQWGEGRCGRLASADGYGGAEPGVHGESGPGSGGAGSNAGRATRGLVEGGAAWCKMDARVRGAGGAGRGRRRRGGRHRGWAMARAAAHAAAASSRRAAAGGGGGAAGGAAAQTL